MPNKGSRDLGHVTKKLKINLIFLKDSNNGVINFQMIFGFSVLSKYFSHKFLSKPPKVIFNIIKRLNRGTAKGLKRSPDNQKNAGSNPWVDTCKLCSW